MLLGESIATLPPEQVGTGLQLAFCRDEQTVNVHGPVRIYEDYASVQVPSTGLHSVDPPPNAPRTRKHCKVLRVNGDALCVCTTTAHGDTGPACGFQPSTRLASPAHGLLHVRIAAHGSALRQGHRKIKRMRKRKREAPRL